MSISTLDIVSALQLLTQSALTAQQITDLMARDDVTEADVQAQLDKTDATIDRLKADDA
jgi:hypothetical protein